MILDELVLHDFGVYGGRQTVKLTPEKARPITLFGGLNGGGKTTLLDALQLCLYGPFARCSNRNGLPYDDFLRRSVHRGSDAPEAAIELAFRHTANGQEQEFRLHRSWRTTPTACRETFHVLRNGVPDKMATEHWSEQVEDFIPARIAHLFLFDGEKVESYAELDGAPALISTAIQNLLGLDIVERLSTDLEVLERRKRTENKTSGDVSQIEQIRGKISALEAQRLQVTKARAAAANTLDRRCTELKAIEERYRRDGGALFERRSEAEAELAANERQLTLVERELRDLAGGCAPLLMVGGLLESAAKRADREEDTRRRSETDLAISEEFDAIMTLPAVELMATKQRLALRRELDERLSARRAAASHPIYLNLTADTRSQIAALLTNELPSARERIVCVLGDQETVDAALEHSRNAIAASPSHDAIAGVIASRESVQAEVGRLTAEQAVRDNEIATFEREITQLLEQEARQAEAEARERFAREDVNRMLQHSTKVRETLGRFREAVVERHVARIERLVLDSFRQLIHKGSLIADLRIDPRTFAIELRGTDAHTVTPDRLSAGERQLLAIAILWGLGRSSGRPLPTVIDTPLGRLDSVHRTHLVKRYFPQASHQVLLLSTDEEIMGSYYEALRPSINRTYHLRFDEAQSRTIVEPGYLGQEVSRAH